MSLVNMLKAAITRSVFAIHAFLAIWRVVESRGGDKFYWLLTVTITLLVFEGIVSICSRRGEEMRWFCPSVFFYLCSVVPPIWLLELDLAGMAREGARSASNDAHTRFNSSVATPSIVTSGPNATFSVSSSVAILTTGGTGEALLKGGHEDLPVSDIQKKVVVLHVLAAAIPRGMWAKVLEQTLLVILIMGRWILPKGDLTRDQLSQLLLVYTGMAADIAETFEALREPQVVKNRELTYVILGVWSWSLVQFTLVLTSTKGRKPRFGGDTPPSSTDDSNNKAAVYARPSSTRPSSVPPRRSNSGVFSDSPVDSPYWDRRVDRIIAEVEDDMMRKKRKKSFSIDIGIIAICTTVFLQDCPFLVVRLTLILHYKVVSYSNLLFTCKNTLVITLQLYRLAILICAKFRVNTAIPCFQRATSSVCSGTSSRDGHLDGHEHEEAQNDDVDESDEENRVGIPRPSTTDQSDDDQRWPRLPASRNKTTTADSQRKRQEQDLQVVAERMRKKTLGDASVPVGDDVIEQMTAELASVFNNPVKLKEWLAGELRGANLTGKAEEVANLECCSTSAEINSQSVAGRETELYNQLAQPRRPKKVSISDAIAPPGPLARSASSSRLKKPSIQDAEAAQASELHPADSDANGDASFHRRSCVEVSSAISNKKQLPTRSSTDSALLKHQQLPIDTSVLNSEDSGSSDIPLAKNRRKGTVKKRPTETKLSNSSAKQGSSSKQLDRKAGSARRRQEQASQSWRCSSSSEEDDASGKELRENYRDRKKLSNTNSERYRKALQGIRASESFSTMDEFATARRSWTEGVTLGHENRLPDPRHPYYSSSAGNSSSTEFELEGEVHHPLELEMQDPQSMQKLIKYCNKWQRKISGTSQGSRPKSVLQARQQVRKDDAGSHQRQWCYIGQGSSESASASPSSLQKFGNPASERQPAFTQEPAVGACTNPFVSGAAHVPYSSSTMSLNLPHLRGPEEQEIPQLQGRPFSEHYPAGAEVTHGVPVLPVAINMSRCGSLAQLSSRRQLPTSMAAMSGSQSLLRLADQPHDRQYQHPMSKESSWNTPTASHPYSAPHHHRLARKTNPALARISKEDPSINLRRQPHHRGVYSSPSNMFDSDAVSVVSLPTMDRMDSAV